MTSNIQNAGLLTLRAGVGGVLIAHGVQKLFGWLGGTGLRAPRMRSSRWDSGPAAERHRSGAG